MILLHCMFIMAPFGTVVAVMTMGIELSFINKHMRNFIHFRMKLVRWLLVNVSLTHAFTTKLCQTKPILWPCFLL